MSSRKATAESPLLHLWKMCGQNGPPLSLGQQLCRILQPEVLPVVFGIRGPGLIPCAHLNSVAVIPVYGVELYDLQEHFHLRPCRCCNFPGSIIRPFCCDHVFRSSVLHTDQYINNRQSPKGEGPKHRVWEGKEGSQSDGMAEP